MDEGYKYSSSKKLLLDTLPSDKEKIAYHYSDGRDSRAVSTVAGVHFTPTTTSFGAELHSTETLKLNAGKRALPEKSFYVPLDGKEQPRHVVLFK